MKSGWANGWRGIFALALLTGAASTRAQAPPGGSVTAAVEEEPKIVAIRMVKEDGQELSNTLSGIAVETGKTLDPGKIADSLRALYRTGDYADLRAVVTPVADGVRWISWCGRICSSTRCASPGSPRHPARPQRRRPCSSHLAKPTGRRPSARRWNGCEKRFAKRVCIRPRSPRKRCRIRRPIRWTLLC